MNKIIKELTQIANKILETNPDFTQIDKELKIIEQKLDK